MKKIHTDIRIYGIVQGVGFRPFVHKAATEFGLSGFVRNTSFGAEVSLEGSAEDTERFISKLRTSPPPLAYIEEIDTESDGKLCGYTDFRIAQSEKQAEMRTLVSPDIAICEDCLAELYRKDDRRYAYPFINCTNCGPRFTIVKDIPYDRKNTTMAPFVMCAPCAAEYEDITDRRYHAQPDCCAECGPELYFVGEDKKEIKDGAILCAREYIKDGKIVAIKGLGGVHLACRCDDEKTVRKLRERKRRDEKPFAIMCRDIESAKEFAEISKDEERFLLSPARPIVLLKKRKGKELAHLSRNGYIGIMLPYTPMHYLLLEDGLTSAVVTSANISELPVIYKNEEAKRALSDVADAYLLNNREIHTRCDDSLMWVYRGREYFARRSRGYVPYPISSEVKLPKILACGAEQKASFALSRERHVFPSQHIGDLKNLETFENYEMQIEHFEKLFDITPDIIACDMHPDYMSTAYAEERARIYKLPLYRIQHHHAHMASCMADNRYDGKCIGIIWDGTGYGTDGKVWGAEFLVGDYASVKRLGTIHPITLPGGDRTTKEISRIADSLRYLSGLSCDEKVKAHIESDINCPKVTSMGRLFDGVSAMLGIVCNASYEGQGATLLEAAAAEECEKVYPHPINLRDGMFVFDWRDMIREIAEDIENSVPRGEIAAAFMNTLVSVAAKITKKISDETGICAIALSGGSFQNMYILLRLDKKLTDMGYTVLTHRRVSCNDEGICLGQTAIAARLAAQQ